jgi:hypothetical protein
MLKEKLGLSNDYQINVPLSRKEKGKSTISDDEIKQFKVRSSITLSSGNGLLPNNYFKYDDIRSDTALEPVELLTSSEVSRRLQNAIDFPDILFPIAEILGSRIYVYPQTITNVKLTFYRYPSTPSVSYYVDINGEVMPLDEGVTYTLLAGETGMNGEVEGEELTSQTSEHEWGDESAPDLAYIIVKNMGINLSRGDVSQAANQIKERGI